MLLATCCTHSPTEAEQLNRRLALALGADKTGWDLTQLLRPADTRNYKYPDAPVVRVVDARDGRYDPQTLDGLPPALPQQISSTERVQPHTCSGHPGSPALPMTRGHAW